MWLTDWRTDVHMCENNDHLFDRALVGQFRILLISFEEGSKNWHLQADCICYNLSIEQVEKTRKMSSTNECFQKLYYFNFGGKMIKKPVLFSTDFTLGFFDPRGRPTSHDTGSNHCFRTSRPSPLFKTKQISSKNNVRYWRELWVWPSGSLIIPVLFQIVSLPNIQLCPDFIEHFKTENKAWIYWKIK